MTEQFKNEFRKYYPFSTDETIKEVYELCIKENARKAGSHKKTVTPERREQLRKQGFQKKNISKNP